MSTSITNAIRLLVGFILLGALGCQQNDSRLKLLVGPDEICATPTQCFTSGPGGTSEVIVTTCTDTENGGGCASFAVACIYAGGTYEGNNNKGKCTT